MKKVLLIIVALGVAATAVAEDSFAIQARLGVVHYDAADINTFYNYIAAVPACVFHYNGTCYESPLVTDGTPDIAGYFHEDLAAYYDDVGGLQQLWAIGDVPEATITSLSGTYGVSPDKVVRINASTPAALAEIIARDWTSADEAVLVPVAPSPSAYEYESAANGAALAAMLNVPLLFVDQNSVPQHTMDALGKAGVKDVYLVEFNDYCGPGVNAGLANYGFNVKKDYTEIPDFVADMRARAGHSALMTYRDNAQTMPAALGAARHGGYVVLLDTAVVTEIRKVAALIASTPMPTEKFPVGTWKMPEGYDAGEQAIAAAFLSFLDDIGGTDPSALEWVTYFGPKSGGSNEFVNFDRAIVGDPEEPTEPGCISGRMPGTEVENVFVANRDALYRAMIFGNPHPKRTIMAFNAFSCHYYEQGYTFTDNHGQGRCVNEIFGVPEFNEDGVAERSWTNSYETFFDAGSTAGTYQGNNWHPINPAGHTLEGYFNYLNDGSCFYYYSGHGSTGSISSMVADSGCAEQIPWGSLHWPSTAGKITSAPGNVSLSTWDSSLDNIHGTIITFDACLCGGGDWNEVGMRHGGGGGISSYISVSWEGSGWCWCLMADWLMSGKTAGEAVAYGLANTSSIYPQNESGADDTLMYYWAGDPFMVMCQTSWERPSPAPLIQNYGGHGPGGLIGIELAYFRAARAGDDVKLTWATSANASAGFNVYREVAGAAAGSDGVRSRLNAALIRGQAPYSFVDIQAPATDELRYWLEVIAPTGEATVFGPVTAAAAQPKAFALAQNFPNPTAGRTTIVYAVPAGAAGKVALEFYDLTGRRVAAYDVNAGVGEHRFVWDAAGTEGAPLAAGVYIYRLRVDGANVAVRRLVLVR